MTISHKSISTHYTNSLSKMIMENKSNQDLEEHSIPLLKRINFQIMDQSKITKKIMVKKKFNM
jgi:hypothetical protein